MAPSRTFAHSHQESFSESHEEWSSRRYDQSNSFSRQSNRLILCFDGTGNEFKSTPADTNIVKLYNMFDRSNLNQMHYYQPGIGTYPAEGPVNVNFFRSIMRKLETILDQALATSFDSHVIAGYKFIMRYYKPGDRIYIFGFSRGAFTARFLARMISHVGLLSMGNDELVPFAYQVYQKYEQNRGGEGEAQEHTIFMNSFKEHFCRTEPKSAMSDNESGIKVHFLGLFDCVSSVGTLDIPFFQKTPPLPACTGTARHIRHAVAIDERRVKFKAALFSQEKDNKSEDIKEVWFPGNHGDIGGGWTPEPEKTNEKPRLNTSNDPFQLSDIALKWMVDELDRVEAETSPNPADRLAWAPGTKTNFLDRFHKNKDQAITARLHDTMRWNMGSRNLFKIGLWNFMEYLPGVIKRWELIEKPTGSGKYEWSYVGWPPNLGDRRDIPSTALFHHSVLLRMRLAPNRKEFRPRHYLPNNGLWVRKAGSSDKTDVVKCNLEEIAKRESPKATTSSHRRAADTVPLTQPGPIVFEHDAESTLSSVQVNGHGHGGLLSGGKLGKGKDWDNIYRVTFAPY